MSNAIFPTLPGLAFNITRNPIWSTNVDEAASGREYSLGNRLYPKWHYKLPFEVLREYGSYSEWQSLVGFINARKGRVDDFLYQDPRAYSITTPLQFGTGDGTSTSFLLLRSLGSFLEPVGGVNTGGVTVYVNGVPTAVTYDANLRIVTFASAPAAAAALTWVGQYYMRCRFLQDEITVEEILQGMHSAKSVEFRSYNP